MSSKTEIVIFLSISTIPTIIGMKDTIRHRPPELVTKQTFAPLIDCSVRTVDRMISAKIIPAIKVPSIPDKFQKCHGRVLIPVADALAALNRFRINAIGEPAAPIQPPKKRRAGRIAG